MKNENRKNKKKNLKSYINKKIYRKKEKSIIFRKILKMLIFSKSRIIINQIIMSYPLNYNFNSNTIK